MSTPTDDELKAAIRVFERPEPWEATRCCPIHDAPGGYGWSVRDLEDTGNGECAEYTRDRAAALVTLLNGLPRFRALLGRDPATGRQERRMSDDLEYEKLIEQPYKDCAFSAGFVLGHQYDTLYLRLERDGEEPTTILLRADEAAALAWCLTGALWSERMRLDAARAAPADGSEP